VKRPWKELLVAALLGGSASASVGFVVAYAADASTQLLGGCLGAALLLASGAAILLGSLTGAHDVEDRPALGERAERREARREVTEQTDAISRRRLLAGGAVAATAALGAAVVVPAASLGPSPGSAIGSSPWRRGLRVVDEQGRQYRADDVEIGTFLTGFPDGADPRELGSPVVIVRLTVEDLRLPPERSDWAPDGLLAFSKICTHAGCAVNLYRHPLFAPTSPRPALVCPCHYSTFDPSRGAEPIFGPAGRPLPQLPLAIDADGGLVAAGELSGPVGPAWPGVRSQES
jgi:ubiquinol-cytochrome c reductase iron-sulfur subunit